MKRSKGERKKEHLDFSEAWLHTAFRRKRGEKKSAATSVKRRFTQLLKEKGERKKCRDFSEAPLHIAFRRKRGEKGDFQRSTHAATK